MANVPLVMAALVATPTPTMRLTVMVSPTRPRIAGSPRSVATPSAMPAMTERTVVGTASVTSVRSRARSQKTLRAVRAKRPLVSSSRSLVTRTAETSAARAGPSTWLACSVPWMVDCARTIW